MKENFFHDRGFAFRNPPYSPPLARQVPYGKGAQRQRLFGVPVSGRDGKTDCQTILGVL